MTTFDKDFISQKNPWLSELTVLAETPSTQLEAKSTSKKNSLYLTDRQTATYGRFGRNYFAPETGGIYMSINLGSIDLNDKPIQYTLLAAVAVVSAIEKLTDKKPLIKWVNDIYLDNKKLVGILAESGPSGTVLGMGINFQIKEFPDDLLGRATSLFGESKPDITESDLIAEIWSEFYRLKSENYLDIYKSHCFILGMTVEFTQNNQNYQGRAIDLSPLGELIIDCNDGIQRCLNSGEISLKKWTD
ncbi:MAG: biotin--[acetyl-CoA-carboxylase] ligase [Streptococcaceae bacterium]|jgi:BirA family biotin operon repressor/biotin-[acetyl-CoA-carboxylase] ligase|nr:biotin--[acetyl-CoA-carboxylase] ligase [Streptococcaceae bacterium]